MSKVPFKRRVSDFFTQGHWRVKFWNTSWTISFGGWFWIDGASGFHFDSIGFEVRFWTWTFQVAWVDNN